MKKYIAEFIGTFALTFVVALSIAGKFPVSTPVLAGLVLALFVYSIGHLSGSHINPAVTIGAWSIKKISTIDATGYVISQVLGAVVAMFLAYSVGVNGVTSRILVSNLLSVGVAEALGMFFFTFGIASVVYGKVQDTVSGLVVGGSLLLGIAIAALFGSNGVLNPAVALGIGSFGIMYVLGPIVGSIVGMNTYRYISK
jgi:glycerol uptake facilitator-like aquaporin